MNRRIDTILLVLVLLVVAGVGDAGAQTAGLGLDPGRMEVEMKPGQEKRSPSRSIHLPPIYRCGEGCC